MEELVRSAVSIAMQVSAGHALSSLNPAYIRPMVEVFGQYPLANLSDIVHLAEAAVHAATAAVHTAEITAGFMHF